MTETPDQTLLPAFPRHMGVVLTVARAGRVEAYLDVTPVHGNRNGVTHGGAIMALADALGGVAASLNLMPDEHTTTIESKSNFLRALPLDERATAICLPLHVGRKTAVLQITVTRADGKSAAIVTQTQLTLEGAAPKS